MITEMSGRDVCSSPASSAAPSHSPLPPPARLPHSHARSCSPEPMKRSRSAPPSHARSHSPAPPSSAPSRSPVPSSPAHSRSMGPAPARFSPARSRSTGLASARSSRARSRSPARSTGLALARFSPARSSPARSRSPARSSPARSRSTGMAPASSSAATVPENVPAPAPPLLRQSPPRQVERTWFSKLGKNPVWIWGLMLGGAICAALFPSYFTGNHFYMWLNGALAVISFSVLSMIGFIYRDREILRRPEQHHWVASLTINVFITGFTIFLGVSYDVGEDAIIGFTLLAVAVFCLEQIAQPKYDYGLLQLFVCVPLQVAILHYRPKFRLWYVVSAFLPIFCLTCQAYFVKYVDDDYNITVQIERRVEIVRRERIV